MAAQPDRIQIPQQQHGQEPGSQSQAQHDQVPPLRAPAVPQRRQAQHHQQHHLRRQGEQPEGVRGHQQQRRDGIGSDVAGAARAHEQQQQPHAAEGGGQHGGVSARKLCEVHHLGDGRDQHCQHGAAGSAEQLAAEAIGERDGEDAEQRGGQAQPQHVVAQHQRRVHGKVVQRRPVAVVDGDVQHVARRRARCHRQRHALVVVQRPVDQPEAEHGHGIGEGRQGGNDRRPACGQERAHGAGL